MTDAWRAPHLSTIAQRHALRGRWLQRHDSLDLSSVARMLLGRLESSCPMLAAFSHGMPWQYWWSATAVTGMWRPDPEATIRSCLGRPQPAVVVNQSHSSEMSKAQHAVENCPLPSVMQPPREQAAVSASARTYCARELEPCLCSTGDDEARGRVFVLGSLISTVLDESVSSIRAHCQLHSRAASGNR